ncbi:MAG: hypothetical protein RL196_1447 [Actinomycetota bacterium]
MSLLPTKGDVVNLFKKPGPNLLSGVTVALVALPLALGFGIASGMGPQAGITAAVIAGFLAALFGGSNFQVSGPTGAMTVVLIPIYAKFSTDAILLVGLGAGIILLVAAFVGLGHHIHRLPVSLIEGITAGIALVIMLQQLPAAFGVTPPTEGDLPQKAWAALIELLQSGNFGPLSMSAAVATLVVVGSHRFHRLPVSLIVVVLATVVAQVWHLPLADVGSLPPSIGSFSLNFFGALVHLPELIVAIFSVAALAALESLLSAKVADRMKPDQPPHDSDRELFGQAIANLVTPFLGGVPSTAALARTAVNIRSGATNRLAALVASVLLGVLVLGFSGLVSQIPLAALAGVLIATATHMVKPSELWHVMRGSRLDALVLLATAIATVALDLTTGLFIGLALWLILRKSRLSRAEPLVDEDETLGD